MIREFGEWLATTKLSLAVATTSWVIPAAQSIHILAVGIVIGASLLITLRTLGVAAQFESVTSLQRRFLPWIWGALVVLFLSGVVQIIGEPKRAPVNHLFQLKMLLLLGMIVFTVVFHNAVRRHAASWDRAPALPLAARITMAASMLVWITIIFLGRWIAYARLET